MPIRWCLRYNAAPSIILRHLASSRSSTTKMVDVAGVEPASELAAKRMMHVRINCQYLNRLFQGRQMAPISTNLYRVVLTGRGPPAFLSLTLRVRPEPSSAQQGTELCFQLCFDRSLKRPTIILCTHSSLSHARRNQARPSLNW